MRPSHEYQHNPWPDVNYCALLERAGIYPAVRRRAQEPHPAAMGADLDRQRVDRRNRHLPGRRADLAAVPVTVVTNAKNLGFPAAINQGLRLARGEYLVMLNNDVVVTDGWLDQLIALANARPGRGHGSPAHDEEEGGQEQSNITILDLEQEVAPLGEAVDGMAAGRGPARAIGLVGPMSNYAAPPQLVEERAVS